VEGSEVKTRKLIAGRGIKKTEIKDWKGGSVREKRVMPREDTPPVAWKMKNEIPNR